jgi:hypothetical protein
LFCHALGDYHEEYVFRDRVMQVLDDYDDLAATTATSKAVPRAEDGNPAAGAEDDDGADKKMKPLFLVYTPHVIHCPLQVTD